MYKRIFFILVASLLVSSSLLAQDLPNYLTDQEKALMQSYIPKASAYGFTTPPNAPIRTMAEWEELDGLLITWTSYTSVLRQIVKFAQEECRVYIVCSDSNTVKSYLSSGGVSIKNIKFIIAPFNSVWCRDYGPWSVYSKNADSLYIIDWIYNRPRPQDDAIPAVLASRENLPLFQTTTAPYNLIHTGGNFMTDGNGTGFSSKLILTENPSKTESEIDTIMKKFMGINRYIKMVSLPYDEIHHIDMHIKLLDEETLLVGRYPIGIADGPQIEANLQYILANFKTCYGRPYNIVRIPMPPDAQGRYPNNGGDYRTFTNSAIINKTVLVPTYELKFDTTALRIYKQAMPGYNIVGIDCNQTITALGAIHCIVKEIGTREPIFISHAPIRGIQVASTPTQVKAYIKSRSGVASARVFWSKDTTQGFQSISMTVSDGDTFRAQIPQQVAGSKIYYFIEASSVSGKTVRKPLVAPVGVYQYITDAAQTAYVNIISPNGGENWVTGSSQMIRWNSNMVDQIKIELTTDAGLNWSVVTNSTSASAGAYNWILPQLPFNHCIIKVSDVSNNTIFDISDNSFSITTGCMDIATSTGWNLVSVPLITPDMQVTALFPNANSAAYSYNSGYQNQSTLAAGRGYWLRFPFSTTSTICGSPTDSAIEIVAGWNLIGGFFNNFPVTNISTSPAGIITSPFYEYAGGYQQASIIKGGKGYWVRASENGNIQFPADGDLLKSNNSNTLSTGYKRPSLRITDAAGNSQILTFTDQNGTALSFSDAPPIPPEGIFDVRFTTQRLMSSLHEKAQVSLTSAIYPITFTTTDITLIIKDALTDGEICKALLEPDQKFTVYNNRLTTFDLLQHEKPASFALFQNFPNPFNPVTHIQFSVPEKSQVTIELYNQLGQLVETLFSGEKEAGYSSIEWNASNLPSGIYYYKMHCKDYSEIKKLVLLK